MVHRSLYQAPSAYQLDNRSQDRTRIAAFRKLPVGKARSTTASSRASQEACLSLPRLMQSYRISPCPPYRLACDSQLQRDNCRPVQLSQAGFFLKEKPPRTIPERPHKLETALMRARPPAARGPNSQSLCAGAAQPVTDQALFAADRKSQGQPRPADMCATL